MTTLSEEIAAAQALVLDLGAQMRETHESVMAAFAAKDGRIAYLEGEAEEFKAEIRRLEDYVDDLETKLNGAADTEALMNERIADLKKKDEEIEKLRRELDTADARVHDLLRERP